MRSISQIYSEAVTVRNNYLQITELNSGRSNSKLSILNLITYVAAVCIHTYEAILDLFQVRLAEVFGGRINGTPDWYAMTAKTFQYNSALNIGDSLSFNPDTLKLEYETVNENNRIIDKSAWELNGDGKAITLKVCKANTNKDEIDAGTTVMPLNDSELTAFKQFIAKIKFVGSEIMCESLPGDIVKIVADAESPIFYDSTFITASQAFDAVKKSLIEFAKNVKYNETIYYQELIDVIRKTENITDVSNNIKIYIKSYNVVTNDYDEYQEVKGRTKLRSGFLKFLDTDSEMTINSNNLTFVPGSQMEQYYDSLT